METWLKLIIEIYLAEPALASMGPAPGTRWTTLSWRPGLHLQVQLIIALTTHAIKSSEAR